MEAGTRSFNETYDKLQAKKDKAQTSQTLDMALKKINGKITHWQRIMIISTSIKKIPFKVWKDSFVAVNIHTNHRLSFSDFIKNILTAVKTRET